MFMRMAGMIAIGVLCLGGSMAAHGQATRGFDECRSEGVARGLSGDALSDYVRNCTAQPAMSGSTTTTRTFNSCRSEAISRNLSGEARADYIDQCMGMAGTTAEPASGAMGPKFHDCRTRAAAQGIKGAALDKYMDDCVAQESNQ